jgi:hypothetical protein
MAASIVFLITGFSIGMARLGKQHGFLVNDVLEEYISAHPVLMVFGVIGGLLIAEKMETMSKFLIFKKVPISYFIIATMLPGVLIFTLGYTFENAILRYTGSALVAITGILFMGFMISRKNHGNLGVKLIMGSSLMALTLSSIAESITSAVESAAVALLLLSFPVIYILGERIELGQMRSIGKNTMRFLIFSSAMIPVLLFLATFVPSAITNRVLFDVSITFLLILTLSSIKFDLSTRKLKNPGKLQSYMQFGIVSSYAWLLVGIILYIIQVNVARGFMDSATHSIALGFIGLFIIAHSPIIFPMALKLKVDTSRVTKLPIYTLNLAVLLRVSGDLISKQIEAGNVMAFYSAYVLIIAIILFVFNIWNIRIKTGRKVKETENSG